MQKTMKWQNTYLFHTEDPLGFAINSIIQALTIKRQYDLHNEGKTKFLVQLIGRSFEGQVSDKFEEAKQGVRFDVQNANTNKMCFNTLICTFLMKSFPEDTLEDQKECVESAKCPGDMTPENYIEQIMLINKCLLLLKVVATNYWTKSWSKSHPSKHPWSNSNQIHFKRRKSRNRLGQGQEYPQQLLKDSCSSRRIQQIQKLKNKDKLGKKKEDQTNGKEKAGKTNLKPNSCRK